ncbi:unannotated protein [freshwater metagenome]|uniref:Unannotated protein n=1 Tax=freshwater metagenome TaxID=449393 RepID=A0A6J7E7Y8_9ZZZZ|nr:hypothetical protein [Actinomycetota bacterium]
MTKNKKSQIPVVTDIPLKNTDTPLVIDLPDGQKLVVGKLTTGSVIEVATWRGTGRPDSRTSRLMLGMSDVATIAEVPGVSATDDSPSAVPSSKSGQKLGIAIFAKFYESFAVVISKALPMAKKLFAMVSSKKGAPKVTLAQPYREDPLAIDDDVNEWLNQITAKAHAQSERKLKIEGKKAAKLPSAKKQSTKKSPVKPAKKAPARKKSR